MTQFSDLNLDAKILKAIVEAGYTTPTPIQEGAIPAALQGRDVLGIAQTGTGKTAGFVLPMIHALARGRAKARMPRSLVLCPTRELAAQVAENFDTYSKYVKLTKALLIGGVSFKEQDLLIDKGVDVLIATPGRLLDHQERGKLILNDVKIMVVDEADRMLDMGFIPDIERIFGLVPFTRQTLFFSATMAPEIERITNTFLSNPVKIEVARQATASETIEQGVVMFQPTRKDRQASEKRNILRTMIDNEGDKCTNAIIFCNRKTDVDIVSKSLKKDGYDAAPIHGDLDQSQRTRTLDLFREGKLRFLVASDVAARGLDVPSVSHVFNFDVSSHAEDYVHRIGRTGRAGRDGKAMMICVPSDEKNLEDIERLLGKPIPRLDNPLGKTAAAPAAVAATPAPTDATGEDAAPRPERRTRSRTRKPATDKTDVKPEAKPEARSEIARAEPVRETAPAPTPALAPAPVTARTSAPEASENTDRKRQPAHDKGERRQSSDRGRSSRHNDNGDKGVVVGLGDHLPGFIAMSFDERRAE